MKIVGLEYSGIKKLRDAFGEERAADIAEAIKKVDHPPLPFTIKDNNTGKEIELEAGDIIYEADVIHYYVEFSHGKNVGGTEGVCTPHTLDSAFLSLATATADIFREDGADDELIRTVIRTFKNAVDAAERGDRYFNVVVTQHLVIRWARMKVYSFNGRMKWESVN